MARGENTEMGKKIAITYGPQILGAIGRGISGWWRARRERKAAERAAKEILKRAETEDVSDVSDFGEGGRQ